MMLLLWILGNLLLFQAEPIQDIPLGQVTLRETVPLYDFPAPDADAQARTRARPGDVLRIYQLDDDWARTDGGWFALGERRLQPAVVDYGARFIVPLTLSAQPDGPPQLTLSSDSLNDGEVGVIAISGEDALFYSREGVGWGDLSKVTLTAPSADLRDFYQQAAYVMREAVYLLDTPDSDTPDSEGVVTGRVQLGDLVAIVYQAGPWVLLRSADASRYGWARTAAFDRLPLPYTRGNMSAGPVNLRATPDDGRVIFVLDFGQPILVYGRDAAGEWLQIALPSGLSGWVFAEFVALDDSLERLPILSASSHLPTQQNDVVQTQQPEPI